jgi:hypothetical protein
MDTWIHTFSTSALVGGEWQPHTRTSLSPGKIPPDRGEPRSRSGRRGDENNLEHTGTRTPTPQPSSPSPVAVTTPLRVGLAAVKERRRKCAKERDVTSTALRSSMLTKPPSSSASHFGCSGFERSWKNIEFCVVSCRMLPAAYMGDVALRIGRTAEDIRAGLHSGNALGSRSADGRFESRLGHKFLADPQVLQKNSGLVT